jgi:adhesin transport system membrane fusion protein
MKNNEQKSSRSDSAKERQLRFLSQSVRLEEAAHPRLVNLTLYSTAFAVLAFIAWAAFTNINEVARAPGEVVPRGFQQVVQHFDGGIVEAIHVTEGSMIDQGDVLVVLDGVGAEEDLARAKKIHISLELQQERLRAFINDRTPDFSKVAGATTDMIEEQNNIFNSMVYTRMKERNIIEDQISQKQHAIDILEARRSTAATNVHLMQDMHDRRQTLHGRGYVSHIGYLQTKRDLNMSKGDHAALLRELDVSRSGLKEYSKRLESLSATHRDQAYHALDQVEQQLTQNEELLAKASERVARLEVKAPVRGLVKGLNVNTIGGVVQPGSNIMEIIPLDEKLVVEVRIPPRYVGPMKVGQPAQVKVSSYDFSRYGSVSGVLEFISATTFDGPNGERFYRGRVALDKNYVGSNPEQNVILPGMTVMADIITGNKTILQYLLKPVHRALLSSFSER